LSGTTHRLDFTEQKVFTFLNRWRETLGTNPEPKQREAVEFAQLAKDRYSADSGQGQPYISARADMRVHIERDPQCEVAGFML